MVLSLLPDSSCVESLGLIDGTNNGEDPQALSSLLDLPETRETNAGDFFVFFFLQMFADSDFVLLVALSGPELHLGIPNVLFHSIGAMNLFGGVVCFPRDGGGDPEEQEADDFTR